MRFTSRFWVFVLAGFFVLATLLVGCEDHIEDANPNSHDLATLTLDDFTEGSISSVSSGVNVSREQSGRTIVPDTKEIDFNVVARSGGKTSGIFDLMGTGLSEGETLTVHTSVRPESGNIALVLLDPDSRVLKEFSITGEDSFQFTAEKSGNYLVRTGMESFSGDVRVERTWQ